MASLSPSGERAVLALLAEQYSEIVDLREALAAERAARQQDLETFGAAIRDAAAPKPDGASQTEDQVDD